MRVEMWSDLICPWCYLGKRRLATAIEHAGGDLGPVQVRYRGYRLNPELPREPGLTMVEYMAQRYHLPPERAADGCRKLERLAAAEGLTFDLDAMRPVDTTDGHRVLGLAAERGRSDAAQERLLAAVLGEGAVITDRATLVGLAVQAGLDEAEVGAVLDGDRYRAELERDEDDGRRYRLDSVPFLLVDGVHKLSGAGSAEDLERTLRRVAPERV